MLKLHTALLTGKSISFLTKKFKKGGGSAAPGLYALKIDPNLIKKLASQIETNVIITGTNGKTTTARMLALFAKTQHISYIRNSTGSNLERGIASTLISSTNIRGQIKQVKLGIWELDEAAFNTVAPLLNPKYIVFLNAFRDQLDRYGEVNSVTKKWLETLKKTNPEAIIINADDANTSKMIKDIKAKTITFGVKGRKITGEGKSGNHKLDIWAENVEEKGLTETSFKCHSGLSGIRSPHPDPLPQGARESINVTLPLPGIYHVYDFLAAITLANCLGFDTEESIQAVSEFKPAFGRVEQLDLKVGGEIKKGFLFLIKNPTGADQIFQALKKEIKAKDSLMIALNDNLADGTDVSWIWDADFEAISHQLSDVRLICSGSRAYDLAIRLKYAGIKTDQIVIEPSIEKAFNEAKRGLKGRLFVLPTYTALMSLQKLLTHDKVKENYWEEE